MAAGLLFTAWLVANPGARAESRPALNEVFSRDNFLAYVGEEFAVYGGPGAHWVVRMQLEKLEDRHRSPAADQFTLWFRAPLGSEPREKGAYFFEHTEAGRFSLWIEPTGEDSGGRYYTVEFNQLLSEPKSSPPAPQQR